MYEKTFFIFLGAVVAFLFQQYRSETSEELAQVNEHIKDIEKFSELAEKYWTQKFATFEEDDVYAARVAAAHASTLHLFDKICHYCSSERYEYHELSGKLFKLTTGDKFRTANREIDPERAAEILDVAHTLIHFLRSARPEIISIRRLLMRIIIRVFVQPSEPWLRHTN